MSNFVTLRHFLGAGPDGDDLGALLRRSTTWWTPWAASWTLCHLVPRGRGTRPRPILWSCGTSSELIQMETIPGHFLGGLPPGETFWATSWTGCHLFPRNEILGHVQFCDLAALLRSWSRTPWAACWTGCHLVPRGGILGHVQFCDLAAFLRSWSRWRRSRGTS